MSLFDFFTSKKKQIPKGPYCFCLHTKEGVVEYYNPFLNFLIYGGMGCGKTASLGKPILKEYLKHHFAGFIYDFKDFDFTKTVYNLLMTDELVDYPYNFYVLNFAKPEYSHRTNPISPEVIDDENVFIQLIRDLISSYQVRDKKGEDPFFSGSAIGLFQAIGFKFYKYFPKYCTIPHIVLFSLLNSVADITKFIEDDPQCKGLARSFLASASSTKTQDNIVSTLGRYLSELSFNKKVLYVLSGEDFTFNLIDPKDPKLVSLANSTQMDELMSPVIALMMALCSRRFSMENKIPFFYMLDEATTFKIPNFQQMVSVQREYLCSTTFITQSRSKIELTYTATELSIIESNFGNHFYGRAGGDIRSIEKYPILFGQHEKEKISYTKGGVGDRTSSSKTISTQKENVFDPTFFTELGKGQFVCVASESNKKKFVGRFEKFDLEESYSLPLEYEGDINERVEENYQKILSEISMVI